MAEDDDDRALFEKALDELSRQDLYRGKFGDAGEPAPRPPSEDDVEAAEEVARLRDLRAMEDVFRDVERMEQGKYRRREPKAVPTPASKREPEPEPEPVVPEPPPEPEVVEQSLSDLVDDEHTLNLRGMRPDKALGQLSLFIDFASKDHVVGVLVIAGREPELRRAVLEWFEGPGKIYARRTEVVDPEGDTRIYAALRPS